MRMTRNVDARMCRSSAKHAGMTECRVNPYCIALILIESDLTPCMHNAFKQPCMRDPGV